MVDGLTRRALHDRGEEAALSKVGHDMVLAGRYQLEQQLGSGPDGTFWRALDTTLDRRVSVRLTPPGHSFALDVADAARRAALVDDPRLVRVLDVGVEDEICYVVSEWTEGRSLGNLVGRAPLGAFLVRRIVGEAAEGLASAATRGLHHLRLTPASVIIRPDGTIKVRGTAVEAAASGLDPVHSSEALRMDAVGLTALLYAGLTGLWPLGDPGFPPAPEGPDGPVPPSHLMPGAVPSDLDTLCAVTLASDDDGPRDPEEVALQLAPWPGPADLEHPERLNGAVHGAPGASGLRSPSGMRTPPSGPRTPPSDGRRLPPARPQVPESDPGAPRLGRNRAMYRGAVNQPANEPAAQTAPQPVDQPAAASSDPATPPGAVRAGEGAKESGDPTAGRAAAATAGQTAERASGPTKSQTVGGDVERPTERPGQPADSPGDRPGGTPVPSGPRPAARETARGSGQNRPRLAARAGRRDDPRLGRRAGGTPADGTPPATRGGIGTMGGRLVFGRTSAASEAAQAATGTAAPETPGAPPQPGTTDERTPQNEPTQPVERTQPVEPTQPVPPVERTQRVEPVTPTAQPSQPAPRENRTPPGSPTTPPKTSSATADTDPADTTPAQDGPGDTRPVAAASATATPPVATRPGPGADQRSSTSRPVDAPTVEARPAERRPPEARTVEARPGRGRPTGVRPDSRPADARPRPLAPWAEGWAGATAPDPRESTGPFPIVIPPGQPPRNQSRVVLAVVAVVVVIGLVLAILSFRDVGSLGIFGESPSFTPSPADPATVLETAKPPQPSAAAPPAGGVPVGIAAIRALDPQGDGDEDTASSPRAVDGNPATNWQSDTYNSARFGGLKRGLGLSLRLKAPTVVKQVTVTTVGGKGGNVEVRLGDSFELARARPVAKTALNGGAVTLTSKQTQASKYVVVWFTSLPQAGNGKYRLNVSEVRVQ